MKRPELRGRSVVPAGALALLSVVAAACGGGGASSAAKSVSKSSTSNTTAVAPSRTTSGQAAAAGAAGSGTPTSGGPGAGAAFAPAATGEIASISGGTLEVQNTETESQTTVDVTAKTRITATVNLHLAAVTPGECITATGTKGAGGAVDADAVSITPVVNGKCGFGAGGGGARFFGGGGGPFAGGGGSAARSTVVTAPAISSTSDFASGEVTSVSGSTIVLRGLTFSFSGTRRTFTTRPAPATPATKAVTVKVSASTRYSKSETVGVTSLKVGECATAFGPTNSIGAVTATRLTVTQPTATGCFAFSGRRFGGGFGGNGAPGNGGNGGFGGGPAAT
ncbi:MAG TPA: hypothetical protein VK425_02325 [Acidimicrobiales bacterium]|nr:hypothetical protein [Acidimicrobiales bacterium]